METDLFLLFLKRSGLRLPNQDEFVDLIAEGDIIEVYDLNLTQIYRSWSVFKVTSYTLADLLVFPFDMLYERPSWILGRLMELVPKALSPQLPIVDFKAEGVKLQERLNSHKNIILFSMKYCTGILGEHSR